MYIQSQNEINSGSLGPRVSYMYTVEPLRCGHLGDLVECPV